MSDPPLSDIGVKIKIAWTSTILKCVFSENNINKIFQNGYLLYQGYVDDPRNTDNSWMETQGKFSSSGRT